MFLKYSATKTCEASCVQLVSPFEPSSLRGSLSRQLSLLLHQPSYRPFICPTPQSDGEEGKQMSGSLAASRYKCMVFGRSQDVATGYRRSAALKASECRGGPRACTLFTLVSLCPDILDNDRSKRRVSDEDKARQRQRRRGGRQILCLPP